METVQDYLNKGWVVQSEGKEYITLNKPKKLNIGWLITLAVFTGGLGALIYIIYYGFTKSGNTVTIKRASKKQTGA